MKPDVYYTRTKIIFAIAAIFFLRVAVAQPSADFTASPTAGCTPLVVQFKDASSGNPTAWNWDFGNGATSSLQHPAATYFRPGTYTITLTVSNTSGANTITRAAFITVYESPTVDFKASSQTGCFPLTVQFTDLTAPGPGTTAAGWLWDFGDGTQSTVQNPEHVYITAGDFTITLEVTNDKGCKNFAGKAAYIKITTGVTADFSNTQPSVCRAPVSVSFTNHSAGAGTLSYFWNFGDGQTSTEQNPVHAYTTEGNFTVSLIAKNESGCTDTLSKSNLIAIGQAATQIQSPDTVCANTGIHFQNNSPPPTSAVWDFGDGSTSTELNPVKTYTTAGAYTVTLINTYGGCIDSASKSIHIITAPLADFTAPVTSKCNEPLTVNFQNQSQGATTWLWDFGDGNTSDVQSPSHTYNRNGNYDVTLIVTSGGGCSDTLKKTAFITIGKAGGSIGNLSVMGCLPYTIHPVFNSSLSDTVISYLWDFGDGGTSTEKTPAHTYTNTGSYVVKLIISTSGGCSDTIVAMEVVKLGKKPIGDFSAMPRDVCVQTKVNFTDLTDTADSWLWTFGDGKTSSMQNPDHAYADTGYFSITLIASNNGCKDTVMKKDYVHIRPPVARFSFSNDCSNPFLFRFRDSSLGAKTWLWDFGDGSTSTEQHPIHSYSTKGKYTVTLTVSNDTCVDVITKEVTAINVLPGFLSNKTELCKGVVLFMSQNEDSSSIVNYSWDFGDGSPVINTPTPRYEYYYHTSGVFTVQLVITDVNGCTDTLTKDNYIKVTGPSAAFNANNITGCKGLVSEFRDLATSDGTSPIVNRVWDFGYGPRVSINDSVFTHMYDSAGVFAVTQIVTDAAGCIDSLTRTNLITINAPPVPAFISPDTLSCPQANVRFVNQSTGPNLSYTWDFGDNTSSAAASPTHQYTSTGFYTIGLKITDRFGCRDSLIKDKYIYVDLPHANFTVNDSISSCVPFQVNFKNSSTHFDSSRWDLGGGISTLTDPIFYYSLPGKYNVELIVTSPGGCKDSITKPIIVFDTVGARINYLPLNGCNPLSVSLSSVTSGEYSFIWDFGDGVVDTLGGPTMTHVYNTFGDFVPRTILKTKEGCLIPVIGPDTISIRGAVAKFGADRMVLCDSGMVNFIDSSTFNDAITDYSWDFGDGTTSSEKQPSHLYTATGIYTINLSLKTEAGCNDTISKPIRVVKSPSIILGGDSTACINVLMKHTGALLTADTSAITWVWGFPNGNNSSQQNPTQQTYATAGDLTITATAVNSSGCFVTAKKNITIYPLPQVTLPDILQVQASSSISIPAVYSSGVRSYTWNPPTYLNCFDCPTPVVSPKLNTRYTVSFIDSNGCVNIGRTQVVVFCENNNVFIPNTFSPNGDGSNDIFYVRGKGLNRVKLLRVFNRWGEVVFERADFVVNDQSSGWDGTYKGRPALADVYVYQAEVYCDNGDVMKMDGNVALIR